MTREGTIDDDFFNHYRDTGCRHSPTCLACPLEQCIHDNPQAKVAGYVHQDMVRAQAVDEAEETMTRAEAVIKVAEEYGITRRTVCRILRRTRKP